MAGDNRLVTEYFLAANFTPKSGVTPGSNNILLMDCTQILARYNVSISGSTSNSTRCPGQNELASAYIEISTPDYLVLKYTWAPGDGSDLDLVSVFRESGIAGLTGTPVGWHVSGNAMNILIWGGDNTQSGDETAMVDITVLTNGSNYPNLSAIAIIDIYANWWATRNSGNCNIELKAYRGGTMSLNGYTWVNSGGTLISTQKFAKNVTTQGTANINTWDTGGYTYLGYINYIKATGIAQLIF